jgi:dihydrofolate reductase
MGVAGGFLLGRKTYEIFAAFWPNQPADAPFADTLNNPPNHVASTTLVEPLKWNNSTLIPGEVADGVSNSAILAPVRWTRIST